MNETYQNRITDQICKIQNDRALIAFYDRLRYAPLGNYAQLLPCFSICACVILLIITHFNAFRIVLIYDKIYALSEVI